MPKKTPEIGTAHTTDGQEVTFEINNVHDARLDGETVDVISLDDAPLTDETIPCAVVIAMKHNTNFRWRVEEGGAMWHDVGIFMNGAVTFSTTEGPEPLSAPCDVLVPFENIAYMIFDGLSE